MKEKRRERRRAVIAIACAAVLAFGAVLSVLTATDTATNKFALSEGIDLRVVEAFWQSQPDTDGDGVPDHAEGILPTQRIAKDPAIENLTSTPVYVFMEVSVPKRTVVTADSKGQTDGQATPTELFIPEFKDGWTLVDTVENENECVYRFYYDEALGGNETTTTLFDEIAMANVQDPDFAADDAVLQVIINGHGVQATGFAGPSEAFDAYFGSAGEEPGADDGKTQSINWSSSFVSAGKSYSLTASSDNKIVSIATATEDGNVTFPKVPVRDGDRYAVTETNGNGEIIGMIYSYGASEGDYQEELRYGNITIDLGEPGTWASAASETREYYFPAYPGKKVGYASCPAGRETFFPVGTGEGGVIDIKTDAQGRKYKLAGYTSNVGSALLIEGQFVSWDTALQTARTLNGSMNQKYVDAIAEESRCSVELSGEQGRFFYPAVDGECPYYCTHADIVDTFYALYVLE